jgi:hypothetical protein
MIERASGEIPLSEQADLLSLSRNETVHHIATRAERKVEKRLLTDFKRVTGKPGILFLIADASRFEDPGVSLQQRRASSGPGRGGTRQELAQELEVLDKSIPGNVFVQILDKQEGRICLSPLPVFWLSLLPFVTSWAAESHLVALPTAAYEVVLLMAAFAYLILQTSIIREQGRDSLLAHALGSDIKGKISPFLYATGIIAANFHTWISAGLYVAAAVMWLVPDRRIEKKIAETEKSE